MKHTLHAFLFVSLFFLLSCEEGAFGPRQSSCQEYRQTTYSGSSENITERDYDNNRITQLRYFLNGNPQGYYTFTYNSEGRISESQFFNAQNNTPGVITKITYNDNGKWIKTLETYSNGSSLIRQAEYNNQDQIIKVSESLTNAAGLVTPRSTSTYEWVNGNMTVYTYTVSTFVLVERYEYDLARENKRRQQQEKTAFLSTNLLHNQNMYRRSIISYTPTNGSTSQSTTDYSYQFNSEGYPVELTRTTSNGTGSPGVVTTAYDYSCDN